MCALRRISEHTRALAGNLDIFGELGVLLETSPGFPLPRLRSAYALTPNTLLAMLTAHDLHECREESPAIDHAVVGDETAIPAAMHD